MKAAQLMHGRYRFPYITLLIAGCCLFVSGLSLVLPRLWPLYAYTAPPRHFWQLLTGAFQHGSQMAGPSLAPSLLQHLSLNLLMILPLGTLVECRVGPQKTGFLFLSSWLLSSALYQLVMWGFPHPAAGASAIGYAFAAPALYLLYQLCRQSPSRFFRQPLGWAFLLLFVAMVVFLLPAITGWQSFVLHLCGVAVGFGFLALFKNSLRLPVAENTQTAPLPLPPPLYLYLLIPLCLVVLAVVGGAGLIAA